MKRMMLLTSLVSVLVSNGVAATYRYWQGGGGKGSGDFEVPANWTQSIVPGAAEWAVFNHDTAKTNYVVTFNSSVTNEKIYPKISSPGYEALFIMNQHVWTTPILEVGPASGGALTFTNGTLRMTTADFSPNAGVLVTNLVLSMKDMVCEMTTATFGAGMASFEGGRLQVSSVLSVGEARHPAATLKLDKGVQCNVANTVGVGSSLGATGELVNVNGTLCIEGTNGYLYVGQSGCGAMTLTGGSTYVSNLTIVGSASTSVGYLTATGGSNTFGRVTNDGTLTVGNSGKGTLLVVGGTNSVGGTGSIGVNAGSVGEITVTNGLLTIGRFLHVGNYGLGFLNVKGGEMRFVNAGDPILSVGRYAGATGMVSVSGGLLDVNVKVWLGGSAATNDPAGGSARLTLSGNGILRAKTIMERDAVATSQLFFDGGTLQAAGSGTLIEPLDDVRLTANGMVVDTAGYTVSVVPTLQDAADEAGGITKKGKGTLTLAGTRAATGPVSVLGGTLVMSNTVAVSAGISRIDGTLSLTSDNRLTVEAGAALAGTGTVARVTLEENAVFARSKADHAVAPLNISDCVCDGHLTVALSGYALTDLLASLPLLKVPTATFVKPTSVSVMRDNVAAPFVIVRYTESDGLTVLNVVYNSGTLIRIH